HGDARWPRPGGMIRHMLADGPRPRREPVQTVSTAGRAAEAGGDAGARSGKLQQNIEVDDICNHVGAAAQERGLVKRYRLSSGRGVAAPTNSSEPVL
ncbi:hypothetical protein ACWEJ6_47620, partial [Nonomuraea sp. NPDC004702]